jgi:hypothetical protein
MEFNDSPLLKAPLTPARSPRRAEREIAGN